MWEYVDVAYQFIINGDKRNSKWQRIHISDLARWRNEKTKAVSLFKTIQFHKNQEYELGEPHWCPYFVDFDYQEERGTTFADTLEDTRKLVDFFTVGFDVEPKVWFSGNRGFHVTVPAELFDARPHNKLSYYWHHVTEKLERKLELKTADHRVYSVRRMWRLENSRHPSSGLYKIPLELFEIKTKQPEAIRELAVDARRIQSADMDRAGEEDAEGEGD